MNWLVHWRGMGLPRDKRKDRERTFLKDHFSLLTSLLGQHKLMDQSILTFFFFKDLLLFST